MRTKSFHTLILFVALVAAGCASGSGASRAASDVSLLEPKIEIAQISVPSDLFYFAGPVSVEYGLSIENPSAEPITLQRIELKTLGGGAYWLNAQSTPINRRIEANSTMTMKLAAWGRTAGGFLAESAPVTLQAHFYFTSPEGSFRKLVTKNIFPQRRPGWNR